MSSDSAIVAGVRSLWEQGHFLDFTIEVASRSFRVNKCIMSAVSDYFHAMVTAGMDESLKDTVKLEAVSDLAMEHLINFIYKDQIELTKANVADVLDGAVYLQMQSAISACTDFILDNLDATLCYEVLAVFQNYSLQDSVSKIRAYIMKNMKSITAECDAGVISYDECCFLVNNWQDYEVDLFYFVKKWIDADNEKRDPHLMDLMSRIRFCLITEDELERILRRYLMRPGVPWFPMVEHALDYHHMPMSRRVLDDSEQNRVRSPPNLTLFCAEYDTPRCYILNADKQWKRKSGFCIPPNCHIPCAAVEVNNNLVVVKNDAYSQGLIVFDTRMLSWSELAPREVRIGHFATVYHAGYFYIVGGAHRTHVGLDTVERYDFQTNTWNSFTALPDTRLWHAACVYQDCIYISGGRHTMGGDSLYKVDCLNLSTLEWQSKAPMLEAQCRHKMYTMKLNGEEVICVLGRSFQVDYYDSSSDQWSRFDFSCEYKLPKNTPGGAVITRGNTVYFIDDHSDGVWNNGGVCFEVTFPETGKDLSMNKIKHFNRKPNANHEYFGLCGAVLAYKYQ